MVYLWFDNGDRSLKLRSIGAEEREENLGGGEWDC